jgi:hypothetical protein
MEGGGVEGEWNSSNSTRMPFTALRNSTKQVGGVGAADSCACGAGVAEVESERGTECERGLGGLVRRRGRAAPQKRNSPATVARPGPKECAPIHRTIRSAERQPGAEHCDGCGCHHQPEGGRMGAGGFWQLCTAYVRETERGRGWRGCGRPGVKGLSVNQRCNL